LAATKAGVIPDSSFVLGRVRSVATRAAAIATAIADATRLVPAHAAASVVLLAPLGWYAVASVDPFDAAEPLADPRFVFEPAKIQQVVWGVDQAGITRRLAARWRLPAWVAQTIGSLQLPLSVARGIVGEVHLFAVVQLAILEAEQEGTTLGLTNGGKREDLLDYLRLDEGTLGRIRSGNLGSTSLVHSGLDQNPHHVPLVRQLLRLAGESRRRNGPSLVERLEDRIDDLHRVVADLGEQVGERLRDAKLEGLAELAAGAGHEINNPLAIISGNAQRLLRTEADPARGDSLQAIVRQANRIAGLLRDLMQFARPSKPQMQVFALRELLDSVHDELSELAVENGIHFDSINPPADGWVNADRMQLHHALAAVVRNAIEAAGRDGWTRITLTGVDSPEVCIVVEDSGPGLSAEAVEHAFDPFYCGRTAGRGRGLGLSTAWQLIRQNGGRIRFEATPERLTRFVISLPRLVGYDRLSIRSA
jgi:signal transduction histidine kinase